MTAKEAAHLTSTGDNRADEVLDFIRGASAAELQEFMHGIQAHAGSSYFNWARTALDIRLADEQVMSARKLERQTQQLIYLTWGLVALTLGLLILTLVLVKHEQHPNQQTQNYYEHHEYAA